jgi:hypothetical protein
LKRLLPFQFFQDLNQYANLDSSAALLVYAAISPRNDLKLDGNQKVVDRPNGDLIWDFRDTDLRAAIINNSAQNIADRLSVISPMLQDADLDRRGFYKPGQQAVDRIRGAVLDPSSIGGRDLDSLFFSERDVIFGARDAAKSLASFLGNPSAGLKTLTDFGEKLVKTFNDHMDFIFNGAAFRPLGTLVFLEAARVFAGTSGALAGPRALLGVAALKSGSTFTGDQFLGGEEPGPNDVVVSEHVPSV